MGIRGLFSYIEEQVSTALEWHKLHNCKLIIDGSNLAYDLYHNCTGKNVAFGGDYDKYAANVEDFFQRLLLCGVEPYVVMDGGYPLKRKKFKVIYNRFAQQINTCGRVNPDIQDSLCIFPLMGHSVFVNVIQKLGICVLQCDFEADDEVVVLAKRLNAYVLSNDSDFYLFDIPFILLNSVNFKYIQKEVIESTVIRFIPCYVFNVERFSKITKVPRSLLPVLAPVLGNDFINVAVMKTFYDHISYLKPKTKKMTERHKVIMSVIRWLSSQPLNPNIVLDKIIEILSSKLSSRKAIEIREVMHDYYPTSSTLLHWISKHVAGCPLAKRKKSVTSNTKNVASKINFESMSCLPSLIQRELKCTCEDRQVTEIMHGNHLPDWFIRCFRLYLIPPIIANILNKNYFFTLPQIEFQDKKSVYLPLECIIRAVRGLLWITLKCSLNIQSESTAAHFPDLLSGRETSKEIAQVEDPPDYELNNEDELNTVENETVTKSDDPIPTFSISDEEETLYVQDSESDETDASFVITEEKIEKLSGKSGETEDKEDEGTDYNDDGNINDEKILYLDSEYDDNGEIEVCEKEKCDGSKVCDNLTENVSLKIFKNKKKIPRIQWYIRHFNSLQSWTLESERVDSYKHYPTLFEMERMSLKEKKLLFYKLCGVKIEFKSHLPVNLQFILFIICYWHMKYKKHIHYSTLLGVLMCVLMFTIIDGKYGRKRSKAGFKNVTSNQYSSKRTSNLEDFSVMSLGQLIRTITEEECHSASLALFQFHKTDPCDSRKNYDRCAVHAFSAYQACFYFLSLLNSVLYFPFPILSIDSFWSGTFCYNIKKCFSKRENVSVVVNTIFGNNPRIIHIFMKLYSIIQNQLNLTAYEDTFNDVDQKHKNQLISRKRRKLGIKSPVQLGILKNKSQSDVLKKGEENSEVEWEVLDKPTEEDVLALTGNKFSKLLIS